MYIGTASCQFDEYNAEINGNSLIVRVFKDARMVTRILTGNEMEEEDTYTRTKIKVPKKLELTCTDDGDNVKCYSCFFYTFFKRSFWF